MNKSRYFNSVWRFTICVDSPTYGWVYGFVGWLMEGSFFWHLTAYLKHLSLLQGYFSLCAQKLKNRMKLWIRVPRMLKRFRNGPKTEKMESNEYTDTNKLTVTSFTNTNGNALIFQVCALVKHNTKNVSIWNFVNWSRTKHLIQSHVLMPQCLVYNDQMYIWPSLSFSGHTTATIEIYVKDRRHSALLSVEIVIAVGSFTTVLFVSPS